VSRPRTPRRIAAACGVASLLGAAGCFTDEERSDRERAGLESAERDRAARDRLSAAGPVYRGSYGQRQIEAVELHVARP
jgi:hypothetical protein